MEGPVYRIYLLRHGRSTGNEDGYLQGQADFPLTEDGQTQARLLAERWHADKVSFDLILTSPLSRASVTAGIIAEKLGCPVEQDPLLMERNVGSLAGVKVNSKEELANQHMINTPYRSFNNDGEGNWQLFLRAGQVLYNLLQRDPGRYLLVSHGGLLNQLIHAILGLTPQAHRQGVRCKMENTAFSIFDYYPQEHVWDVITINNYDHLRL